MTTVLPAKAVEGLVGATRAGEPRRRHPLLRALVEDEQLLVPLADNERAEPETQGDVEPPWRTAVVEREVVVHGEEGGVLSEDLDDLVGPKHGAAEESLAGVAVELEGRRPAGRLAGLLQPERVGDVQLAAFLGRAGRGGRRRQPEKASAEQRQEEEGLERRHGLGMAGAAAD